MTESSARTRKDSYSSAFSRNKRARVIRNGGGLRLSFVNKKTCPPGACCVNFGGIPTPKSSVCFERYRQTNVPWIVFSLHFLLGLSTRWLVSPTGHPERISASGVDVKECIQYVRLLVIFELEKSAAEVLGAGETHIMRCSSLPPELRPEASSHQGGDGPFLKERANSAGTADKYASLPTALKRGDEKDSWGLIRSHCSDNISRVLCLSRRGRGAGAGVAAPRLMVPAGARALTHLSPSTDKMATASAVTDSVRAPRRWPYVCNDNAVDSALQYFNYSKANRRTPPQRATSGSTFALYKERPPTRRDRTAYVASVRHV
ncbi:hypothetical protein EVAR_66293_1 [Eumeta japonica]|uniref:Uncharacterized protein n=1 Tax=Eumeta variegata TaxID=151549 RepID=A0A4C1YTN6_EUMVA|nr:hypothetical protein EVAR_66293_1 [Eumeta japonica]